MIIPIQEGTQRALFCFSDGKITPIHDHRRNIFREFVDKRTYESYKEDDSIEIDIYRLVEVVGEMSMQHVEPSMLNYYMCMCNSLVFHEPITSQLNRPSVAGCDAPLDLYKVHSMYTPLWRYLNDWYSDIYYEERSEYEFQEEWNEL